MRFDPPPPKNNNGSSGDNADTSRMIRKPMKTTCIMWVLFLVARLVHNTLCMLDLIPLLSVRLLLMSLSICFGWYTIFVFAAGVIETVHLTIGRTFTQQKSHLHWMLQLRIPSSRGIIWFIIVLVSIATLGHLTLIFMAGGYGQAGDWSRYSRYSRYAWSIWAVCYMIVGAIYTYYALILTQLLPTSFSSISSSSNTPDGWKSLRYHTTSESALVPISDVHYTPKTFKDDGIGRMEFGYITNRDAIDAHLQHHNMFEDQWQFTPPSYHHHHHHSRSLSNDRITTSSRTQITTKPSTIGLSVSSSELELGTKIKSIHRLRGMLFYLLFIYICSILSVFLWGFASDLLFVVPIFNRIFETIYIAVLYPLLACGMFFQQWRIECARKRHERLSSMGRQQNRWPSLPSKLRDDISLNGFDQHDDDMMDDDFNKRLSDPHDSNSPVLPSFPLSF
ncbi:hypothetical protein BDF22DRAFT_678478 [Syncephalis plumigaleata]|nr:hypothetical protein BDF22DRAFT_678478 [Syncephalis plumigaleata]